MVQSAKKTPTKQIQEIRWKKTTKQSGEKVKQEYFKTETTNGVSFD